MHDHSETIHMQSNRFHPLVRTCVLLVPLACTSNTVMLDSSDGGSSSASPTTSTATMSTVGPEPTTSDATTNVTTDPTSGTTTPEPADGTGSIFVAPHDVGPGFECNIFHQDCPAGLKCTFWADDGGSTWNSTRCVPLVEDPAGTGEPCMVEGSGVSGVDDCELGAMCWDVDPETSEGVCVPLCIGSARNPLCADPSRYCSISGDSSLLLCLPGCKPIEQDCPAGQACYPLLGAWTCAPDASGDMGAYGDVCEFINVCNPGLICLGSAAVPPGEACEGTAGCCTEICDLADPLGDAQCAGAAGGQICQGWYEPGTAPPGYDDVGVCALPM